MESSLFLLDLLTGHEPALVPGRELTQLAALRQATRLSRFSARANIRGAVWDKPRSDCTVGVSWCMERKRRRKRARGGIEELRFRTSSRGQNGFLLARGE
jgi:hypothetical protein